MSSTKQASNFTGLDIQMQALRLRANALGLFMDDRNLMECPDCGLREDVTADGLLFTHERETSDARDTGLRFTELPDGRFACPRCQKVLAENDPRPAVAESPDHPVDPGIQADIKAKLRGIEAEYKVRVLYACESGSRGWGFASPDSDYDVRFIYVHPLPWYLQVSAQRDVIEVPISDALDINGWELRKALGLLKNGNATLTEWLGSPVVYHANEPFLRAMREAVQQIHQPERSFQHYVHMARKNYREYLRGETVRLKKYLYVLRPLLATLWIEQGRGLAPMALQELVDVMVTDPALRDAIDQLLTIKRAAMESEYGRPLPIINAFIDTELTRLEAVLPPVPHDMEFAVLDHLLMNTVLRLDSVRPLAG